MTKNKSSATPAAKAEVQHQVISGALFDFAGYLTTLPKEDSFPVGGVHEASPMVSALQNWAKKRSLSLEDANVAGWAEVQAEPVIYVSHVIQDAPGDGDYWVTGMKSSGQHKDPRAAMAAKEL